jgi:hypothetical protein
MENLTPEKLEALSHAALYNMRANTKSPEMQQVLAPLEHQAFAREFVQEKPVLGTASLAVAAPLYELAKALGAVRARSDPSLESLGAAYKGIGQGLGIVK